MMIRLIAISLLIAVLVWLIPVAFCSFVDWDNYFVIHVRDWSDLSRCGYILFCPLFVGVFLNIDYNMRNKNKADS